MGILGQKMRGCKGLKYSQSTFSNNGGMTAVVPKLWYHRLLLGRQITRAISKVMKGKLLFTRCDTVLSGTVQSTLSYACKIWACYSSDKQNTNNWGEFSRPWTGSLENGEWYQEIRGIWVLLTEWQIWEDEVLKW